MACVGLREQQQKLGETEQGSNAVRWLSHDGHMLHAINQTPLNTCWFFDDNGRQTSLYACSIVYSLKMFALVDKTLTVNIMHLNKRVQNYRQRYRIKSTEINTLQSTYLTRQLIVGAATRKSFGPLFFLNSSCCVDFTESIIWFNFH